MKSSKILRTVAKEIDKALRNPYKKFLRDGGNRYINATGICEILPTVYGFGVYTTDKERAYTLFAGLFENSDVFWFGLPWAGSIMDDTVQPNIENQSHRIMALLLAADIAESEGD